MYKASNRVNVYKPMKNLTSGRRLRKVRAGVGVAGLGKRERLFVVHGRYSLAGRTHRERGRRQWHEEVVRDDARRGHFQRSKLLKLFLQLPVLLRETLTAALEKLAVDFSLFQLGPEITRPTRVRHMPDPLQPMSTNALRIEDN